MNPNAIRNITRTGFGLPAIEEPLKEHVAAIVALKKENAKLRGRINILRKAANSAGEWIANAEIAVEPGWEGSQSHILRRLEEAVKQPDGDEPASE